jgi:hypothetical protein
MMIKGVSKKARQDTRREKCTDIGRTAPPTPWEVNAVLRSAYPRVSRLQVYSNSTVGKVQCFTMPLEITDGGLVQQDEITLWVNLLCVAVDVPHNSLCLRDNHVGILLGLHKIISQIFPISPEYW